MYSYNNVQKDLGKGDKNQSKEICYEAAGVVLVGDEYRWRKRSRVKIESIGFDARDEGDGKRQGKGRKIQECECNWGQRSHLLR